MEIPYLKKFFEENHGATLIDFVNTAISSKEYRSLNSERQGDVARKIAIIVESYREKVPSYDYLVSVSKAYTEAREYEKAIPHLKTLIRHHPSFEFFHALGTAYRWVGRYQAALRNYKTAIGLMPKYIWTYLDAAVCAVELDWVAQAEKFYQSALDLDPQYAWTYFLRGKFRAREKRFEEALFDYRKAVSFSEDYDGLVKFCNIAIEEAQIFIKDDAKAKIKECVNAVLQSLRFDGECIAHYTSTDALANMVFNESPLRISEASYLNDPREGEVLIECLGISGKLNSRPSGFNLRIFQRRPFIFSLIKASRSNDLTLWRIYGKSGGEEAAGCCIVFSRGTLIRAIATNLAGGKTLQHLDANSSHVTDADKEQATINQLLNHCCVYQVAYIDSDGKVYIPESDENLATKVQGQLQTMASLIFQAKLEGEDLEQAVSQIAYLFKDAEYSDEREVRIVINQKIASPKINTTLAPPKVYTEVVGFQQAMERIILGPKVIRSNELQAALHYWLDSNCRSVEVFQSTLNYR